MSPSPRNKARRVPCRIGQGQGPSTAPDLHPTAHKSHCSCLLQRVGGGAPRTVHHVTPLPRQAAMLGIHSRARGTAVAFGSVPRLPTASPKAFRLRSRPAWGTAHHAHAHMRLRQRHARTPAAAGRSRLRQRDPRDRPIQQPCRSHHSRPRAWQRAGGAQGSRGGSCCSCGKCALVPHCEQGWEWECRPRKMRTRADPNAGSASDEPALQALARCGTPDPHHQSPTHIACPAWHRRRACIPPEGTNGRSMHVN